MIEELLLPNCSGALKQEIDLAGRSSFDRLHSLGKREIPAVFALERRVDQVHVIGHDNRRMQIEFDSVFVKATVEHDISRCWRQFPPAQGGEGYQ